MRIPLHIITQMCDWQYREEGCGDAGEPVAKVNDTLMATLAETGAASASR